MVTRRRFLVQTAPLTLAPWLGACGGASTRQERASSEPSPAAPRPAGERPPPAVDFLHGVASGDPLARSVILWTRVTPRATPAEVDEAAGEGAAEVALEETSLEEVAVEWLVASDPELREVVLSGEAPCRADADHTVKVDAEGLEPGTTYYYQFRFGEARSAIGRTRTLPEGHVERLRLAVTSCANFPMGYFHAYRKLAERADLDAVLFLGDYLYEYANGSYGDGAPLSRVPDPNRELLSLEDYRRRHAQYKLDPDLQAVHQQHPAIAVWDDHELADNAWRDGAGNHSDSEGDWQERKAAAQRAYFEWMPVRPLAAGDTARVYRTFPFGDLVDLIMLDTRSFGRTALLGDVCDEQAASDPERSLLGEEQEAWFLGELRGSAARGARFRFVGQQVAFAHFLGDPPRDGCIGSRDKWSAYGASRSRVLDAIEADSIGAVVVLTGDSHGSFGLDIARDPFDPDVYDPQTGQGSLAVELMTPGVTSPYIEDAAAAAAARERSLMTHPHLKFTEQNRRGYVLVDVTHERARAEWWLLSSVREPMADESLVGALVTVAGENRLAPAPLTPEPAPAAPPFAPAMVAFPAAAR